MTNTPSSSTTRGSLATIFAVVFIDLLGFGIVLPVLPRYGVYFEADGLVLGVLASSFSAMQFLFAPLWGRLSDRIGRRPVLLIGLAGSAASYLLFGWATGLERQAQPLGIAPLGWLFVSRIAAGAAGATISTAQAYIADVTTTKNRAKGMALIGAAFGCGFTFGPILGAFFVPDNPAAPPSPYPGYLAAGLSAAAFLCALVFLRESRPERASDVARPARPRWAMLNSSARLALFVQILVTTGAFAMFESTLSLLSKSLGYSDRDNFFLFAGIGLTLVLAQGLLVQRLAPRLREWRMAPLGIGLLAVGMIGLVAVESIVVSIAVPFYLALCLCVVGFAFVAPALQSLMSLSAGTDEQGAVLGLGRSASALSRIIGPTVGLPLFTETGPATTYGFSALLMVLALAAIFPVLTLLRRHRQQYGLEEPPAADPDTDEQQGTPLSVSETTQ